MKIALLSFAILASAVVGGIDYFLGISLYRQNASLKYPTVFGRVTESKLISHGGGQHDGKRYYANIHYQYEVGGQSFEGKRFQYFGSGGLNSEQDAVASHPVGSQVQVFYNPREPQDSLLSPGLGDGDLAKVLIVCVPFNILPLIFLYRAMRKTKTSANSVKI